MASTLANGSCVAYSYASQNGLSKDNNGDSAANSKPKRRNGKKIFKERLSLFEQLSLINPYFHGLCSVCRVQFTMFVIFILARDSLRAKRLYVDFSKDQLLLGGIRDWLVFLAVESVLLLVFMAQYPMFMVWRQLQKYLGRVAHFLYLAWFVAYICFSSYFVWTAVHSARIASIPRLVAFIEQGRLILKTYAFIRENGYKVLYPWHKDDRSGPAVWYGGQMSPQVGTFSQYIYFLFAPTLLYRDHYPRNNGPIKWFRVFFYGMEFLGMYLVARVLFLEVQFPASMKINDLLGTSLIILLNAPFIYLLVCLLVFNGWFNFTAELTRFADREFYQNWWSATGHAEYYRTWNVPVYDFLYSYVYQELFQWMRYRPLAAIGIFILSSFLHDFFTGVTMGFFLPVFMVLFATVGGIFLLSGVRFSVFTTFMLTCAGACFFESVFYLELAARLYCPDHTLGHFEYQAPFCLQQQNNLTFPINF